MHRQDIYSIIAKSHSYGSINVRKCQSIVGTFRGILKQTLESKETYCYTSTNPEKPDIYLSLNQLCQLYQGAAPHVSVRSYVESHTDQIDHIYFGGVIDFDVEAIDKGDCDFLHWYKVGNANFQKNDSKTVHYVDLTLGTAVHPDYTQLTKMIEPFIHFTNLVLVYGWHVWRWL